MQSIGVPEGTGDRLFAECAAYRRVQGAVTGLCKRRGYAEIMTPELEFYDLFQQSGYRQEDMLKLVDRSGKLLVLRPDNTTPIARVAATKLKDLPLPQRLYYNQTVYRSDEAHTGMQHAIAQCGVELIGAAGPRAELEVISMAVQVLQAVGLDFCIELGHAGLFQAMADRLNAPAETVSAMREAMGSKNFAKYRALLAPYLSTHGGRAMEQLGTMFGGVEVLERARGICGAEAAKILDGLQALYDQLSAAGLGDVIQFDLGQVQRLDYYTGVVFRGYARGAGSTVLSGGRYDNLIGSFGYDVPATGFAVDVSALSKCIPQAEDDRVKTVVYYADGCLGQALELAAAAPKGSCVVSARDTEEAAAEEARGLGAAELIVVEKTGERRVAL